MLTRAVAAEYIREQTRALDRSIRGYEEEKARLTLSERKILSDIRIAAAAGEHKSCASMAREVVMIRNHRDKLSSFIQRTRGISLQMSTAASTDALMTSMRNVTKSMMVLNRRMKLPTLQKIAVDFQKQSGQMDMAQEMMGDAVDDAMDQDGSEQESDALVNQVLDEIGIDFKNALADAPRKKIGGATAVAVQAPPKQVIVEAAAAADSAADAELEARLNNLKKDG